MIWREPANHVDDRYFCSVNVAGFSSKNKSKINYPNISSAMRPVPHSDNIPVPTFYSFTQLFNETDTCASEDSSIEDDEYYPSSDQEELPVLIKQSFFNDLRPVSTTSVEKSIFCLFYSFFFALASILTARFNRRSIIKTKNALFHARSGNGPLVRDLNLPKDAGSF